MTESSNRTERMPRVAVIGTGTMGSAMAQRLVGAGMDVVVWSRHRSSTAPLVDRGATAFEAASAATSGVDVVITMLPTADVTEEVMINGQGLTAMPPGSVWVQMATIGVGPTERLAEQTRDSRPDVVFVDAPVSGSRAPAESGQLLILASGPDSGGAATRTHLRGVGKVHTLAWSRRNRKQDETRPQHMVGLSDRGRCRGGGPGCTPRRAHRGIVHRSRDNPLASPYALAKLTKMVDNDFHPDFALDLALKDLDLAASDAGPAWRRSPPPSPSDGGDWFGAGRVDSMSALLATASGRLTRLLAKSPSW